MCSFKEAHMRALQSVNRLDQNECPLSVHSAKGGVPCYIHKHHVESTEHSNTKKASDCLRHALDRPYPLLRSPAFSFKLTKAQLSLSVQGK